MFSIENYTLLDLTYPLNENVPTWNGSCGFTHKTHLDYEGGCKVMSYKMHGGIGTHMDAPLHFYKGTASIADIPIKSLFSPIRKIDVSNNTNPDLLISVKDIQDHEMCFGKIPPNHFIIGYTGWGKHWENKTLYRGEDAEGQMHFPGFSKEAALYLLEKKITGIGIDTLSPETGINGFPVHKFLLKAGCYIIENMASLALLPESGAFLIALPLKVEGGVESPTRAIALLPPS